MRLSRLARPGASGRAAWVLFRSGYPSLRPSLPRRLRASSQGRGPSLAWRRRREWRVRGGSGAVAHLKPSLGPRADPRGRPKLARKVRRGGRGGERGGPAAGFGRQASGPAGDGRGPSVDPSECHGPAPLALGEPSDRARLGLGAQRRGLRAGRFRDPGTRRGFGRWRSLGRGRYRGRGGGSAVSTRSASRTPGARRERGVGIDDPARARLVDSGGGNRA